MPRTVEITVPGIMLRFAVITLLWAIFVWINTFLVVTAIRSTDKILTLILP
jgi:hypothetical protein